MQILDPEFEIRLVVLPRHAIHAGTGLALKRLERRPERIDTDVVEERGGLFLLLLPRGLPYAAQRLGHASPALRPVRALLIRVPLGPGPWLRRFRHRSPGFVRRLRGYYAGVRLLWVVHQRLRLLTFPLRTIRLLLAYGRSRDLPVPAQGASVHARVSDHAGSDGRSQ